ncbi:RluA family pseudouridine synthase [Paenibacillus sp. OV219]|uniref:RluA family pseudouridine synthase n=1 Tax=Paenibacillus sp. OV219 TaxID=1884377 RepID=UPI0008D2864C|nr:RluA family pseudouridine synthase [Paenibacillus sp. OV219]SEM66915.1 23S rRNA pseudouridine1911/1915/1917 synthase [Paenibacillus sp. OV219]
MVEHSLLKYERSGEWLSLSANELAIHAAPAGVQQIEAGSHPHHVRQWLLALGLFPERYLNRLFSVGGIQMDVDTIRLRTFVPADPAKDAVYRMAMQQREELEAVRSSNERAQAEVLFQDDWCLVMDKPAGMPVHPNAPGQRGTLDEAAALAGIGHGDHQPAKHIHRLDDDTAGPVLYARNELAQLHLDEAMREKTIGRQYVALVQGVLRKPVGTIDEPIGKDRHHSARRRVSPSGDHAVTHYEVIASYRRATLVRLWLETGRTHQIRVHLSHLGHPLVGDTLYGGSDAKLRHQALRGEQLTFIHPWSAEEMTVQADEPEWFREVRERYASL